MASSGSYARGDQPRSVPDPDKALHKLAAEKQRTYNEAQEAARRSKLLGDRMFAMADPTPGAKIGHPSGLEAQVPIWGSGREALADIEDGDIFWAPLEMAFLQPRTSCP